MECWDNSINEMESERFFLLVNAVRLCRLPMGRTAALRPSFPQGYSVRGNLLDFPITLGSGFKLRVTQHFSNIMCGFQHRHIQHDQAVVGMTPARAEEP